MMTLITGFTCPPTIYFKFITKCGKCYYKVRQLFLLQSAMVCYYKVRQLFYYKVRQVLLQSVTVIAKGDNFITKCDRYYKVRRSLQSATVQTTLKLKVVSNIPVGPNQDDPFHLISNRNLRNYGLKGKRTCTLMV